jgi:hypothetical protein
VRLTLWVTCSKCWRTPQPGRSSLGPFPIADHTLRPGPPFADTLEGTGAVRASQARARRFDSRSFGRIAASSRPSPRRSSRRPLRSGANCARSSPRPRSTSRNPVPSGSWPAPPRRPRSLPSAQDPHLHAAGVMTVPHTQVRGITHTTSRRPLLKWLTGCCPRYNCCAVSCTATPPFVAKPRGPSAAAWRPWGTDPTSCSWPSANCGCFSKAASSFGCVALSAVPLVVDTERGDLASGMWRWCDVLMFRIEQRQETSIVCLKEIALETEGRVGVSERKFYPTQRS